MSVAHTLTKLLLPGLFLVLAFSVKAQLQSIIPQLVIPSDVDSLRTVADVEVWIVQHEPRKNYFYPRFLVDTTLIQFGLACQKQCAKLLVEPWVKADFDGNGYADLLVLRRRSSKWTEGTEPWLFMNYGNQQCEPRRLYGRGQGHCEQPTVIRLENRPAIVYFHAVTPLNSQPGNLVLPSVLQLDTLVFQHGAFMEYNRHPSKHQLEKIEIASGLHDYDTATEITILADRTAIYRQLKDYGAWGPFSSPRPVGSFQATVDTVSFNRIQRVLQIIRLRNATVSYTVNWTDAGTEHLRVSYDQDKVFEVEDCGEQGTFGLNHLYSLLYKLRETQKWRPINDNNDTPTR
ncbi:hypothetical protein [Hymenobacter cavernae]|uniref:VCBS repeat-containing protein n=1 Tax=Hymenobacter cavernae TaxID=2044852 RepID=A0ABQ1U874_9BACT|nr:hypothetical protein [Hymenobacter cavernae]GGF11164.1 hypothetical protein GCM10011383_22940 [Hymenobacter cavernae]